jgi:hypothetical protein
MTLRAVLTFILLVAGTCLPLPAIACSCGERPTVAAELEDSAAVFRGRVLQAPGPDASGFWRDYVFEVNEVWKGPLDPLHAVVTTSNSAACGRTFVADQDYIIFTGDEGLVLLCNRVVPVDQAAAELAVLGPGETPATAPLEDRIRHAFVAGTWYNPERVGEGFVVDLLEDGRGIVFWFGYRADDAAAQSWLYGVGSFTGDTLHVADVLQPVGGGFGNAFDAAAVEQRRWGELRLTLPANGTARVDWSSELPGYGSGGHVLQHLSRPPRTRITEPE